METNDNLVSIKGGIRLTRNIINYSDKADWELHQMIPFGLEADTIVFLPDVNPGKAPLPTGCAIRTKQDDWRKYALSDVGCGMLLMRSQLGVEDFDRTHHLWDRIVETLRRNKGRLGDLGSGNHFLDALKSSSGELFFLIHTGSRDESSKVDAYVDHPDKFDQVFRETVDWAEQNRLMIGKVVENLYGRCDIVVHNNHNHFEHTHDGIIIRKGAVRMMPGELSVLPSHMTGQAVLVKGKDALKNTLYSISHGTGRLMPRSEAKEASKGYDFTQMRKRIYVPEAIQDDSIKTDAPYCYRDIDTVMLLLGDLVEEVERFEPLGYIGHI